MAARLEPRIVFTLKGEVAYGHLTTPERVAAALILLKNREAFSLRDLIAEAEHEASFLHPLFNWTAPEIVRLKQARELVRSLRLTFPVPPSRRV